MLATDLILDGKPDEAIAEFSKITAADPVYDKAQNTMGMIFVQTGRFDEAISHFKTAIEFNPRYSDAYNRLGAVFLDEGKIDEAIPLFYKALEFSPNHPSAWANLGAAFEAKGDMARALDHYGRALQITVGRIEDANLAEALDVAARINFRMGDLLARNGKRTEAMDRYLEVLRYSPGDQAAAQRLKSLRQP
jgi:tetratricopeptide (TPR) repeat protein